MSTRCQKPKKVQSRRTIFALSRVETIASDNFIRGTCFINSIPLITNIDMGVTYSFIYAKFVKRFNIEVSAMNGSMVIDTPTNSPVTTLLVCLSCPLTIYGRDFGTGLFCFPLSQLIVILGMNWLEFNHVNINYFDKSMKFLESEESTKSSFMTVRQVGMFLRESAQLFMLFVFLREGNEIMIMDLTFVCEFTEVFPDDISDFPSEHEVEFTIDLVPGTSLVSMVSYKMFSYEMSELKK
ncbi:uncharacterized protein LOC127104028 [Lathyrus oleraceus]|uniref:uncharacterized protein LOC127104028 n=1 Tax=Pisum sativum TaxID=3888 RepID=UPI0021CF82CF|nr:uncharacterized protein LOC127104028 [Pisum sativum]